MTEVSSGRYAKLGLRGLINIIRKRPLSVSFEITHSCTADCVHCNWGRRTDETRLAPADYGEICRELKPVIAHLSGGEPLYRTDIYDIAAQMANSGGTPMLQVVSNGSTITPKKYHELRKAGVDRFCFSLDFPDKRQDEWRRIPGLFDKLSETLPEIAAYGHNDTLLNCCITGANAADLPEIVRTADSWGFGINFSAYTSLRTDDLQYMATDKDTAAVLKSSVEEVISLKRSGYRVSTSERVIRSYYNFLTTGKSERCMAGWRFLVVNPDGSLSPCAMKNRYFSSQKQMVREFSRSNGCRECQICTRADTEKSMIRLISDNLGYFLQGN